MDPSLRFNQHTTALIYPRVCQHCGGDHFRGEGMKWRRAALAIHPAVIDLLREANPPRRRLMNVVTRGDDTVGIPRPSGDPELRRAAQEKWAYNLIAEREGGSKRGGARQKRFRAPRSYKEEEVATMMREVAVKAAAEAVEQLKKIQ